MELSTSAMHRLIKKQGDKRASEPASNELGRILEQLAKDIAEEAVALAQEEGDQTVKIEYTSLGFSTVNRS